MNKKYYVAVAVVALLITTVGISAIASAGELGENKSGDVKVKFQEKHQEMKAIMDNQDYDAWKALMEGKAIKMQEHLDKMKQNISEENFNNLVKLHDLKQAGDFEGAKELAKDLDMPGKWMKKGFNHGFKKGVRFQKDTE